jgi:hypothetical protein
MTDPQRLVEAIHHDHLATLDDVAVQATCRAIGERLGRDVDEALERLAAGGIAAAAVGEPSAPHQRHAATVAVADGRRLIDAVRCLAEIGYHPWQPVDGPAGAVHRHLPSPLTVARTTDLTTVVSLTRPTTRLDRVLPARLVPDEHDYRWLRLPTALWPAYLVVRPLRKLIGRLTRRPRDHGALGPFLGTPLDAIPALLDLAEVGPDDLLVDIGCGDGRIIVEAAATRGCRAVGVEHDPRLVAQARRRIADAGLTERVEVIDAFVDDSSPLPEGSVYMVFVPVDAASALVRRLIRDVAPGTRIVAHEQRPLPSAPPPQETRPIIVGQAVTVAHRWTV